MAKQTTDLSLVQRQDSQGGVQSVARALDLLEAFPKYGPESGLSRIAALLHLNKATAYRLLSTLEERGYVERSPESRKYRLGVRAFELGSYFINQLEIRRIALEYMQEMVRETREAAFLCIRENDEALCIERVEGEHEVNIFALRVGGRQPLHWGAAPRALLAGMTDVEVQAYASRTGLPGVTSNTITDLTQLLEDVRLTRQRGYVVSMNDATLGIAAVGAPIHDYSGRVVASLSLSGLSIRYGPEQISNLAAVILSTAGRLSRQLGYRGNGVQP
jgi:DNA-binding IclR family transcriptional regulator